MTLLSCCKNSAVLTLTLHTGENIDLSGAYDGACEKLGLPTKAEKERQTLASTMLELARAGERDPILIGAIAVEMMRGAGQAQAHAPCNS